MVLCFTFCIFYFIQRRVGTWAEKEREKTVLKKIPTTPTPEPGMVLLVLLQKLMSYACPSSMYLKYDLEKKTEQFELAK